MYLTGALGGSLMNLLMGAVLTHFDSDSENPELIGKCMGWILLITFTLCGPFLMIAAHYYKPYIAKVRMIKQKLKNLKEDL